MLSSLFKCFQLTHASIYPLKSHINVFHRSVDVGLRRSCIYGVIKCVVESLFVVLFCSVISCVCAQGVELNVSEMCKECVLFVNLSEMSEVYDLVGQPSYA